MGPDLTFRYGSNLLIREEVRFKFAIALNDSGGHERGVSPKK